MQNAHSQDIYLKKVNMQRMGASSSSFLSGKLDTAYIFKAADGGVKQHISAGEKPWSYENSPAYMITERGC